MPLDTTGITIGAHPAATDLLIFVDVSDTTLGAGGTPKLVLLSTLGAILTEIPTAALSDAVADQIFQTTVAVANTETPDGVGHVTGQVQDAQGNSLSGTFVVACWSSSTANGAPADLGDLAAATNSLILVEHTTDGLALVRTHTDGSWGLDYNLTIDGTLHAQASVLGKSATANAAITGN